MYSSNLSKIGVNFNSFAICALQLQIIGQATKDGRLCLKSRWRSFYDPYRVKLIIISVGGEGGGFLREAVEKSRTAATQKGLLAKPTQVSINIMQNEFWF